MKQAGSLVDPTHLRFDFHHFAPVERELLSGIEEWVNEALLEDVAVRTEVMPIEEAVNSGAMALFGEKYGEEVRVVSVPGFSKELCGGTHVASTGRIGLFKITSEHSALTWPKCPSGTPATCRPGSSRPSGVASCWCTPSTPRGSAIHPPCGP